MKRKLNSCEKSYKCDQCDHCSTKKWDLQVHKRTHTGEKPYRCDQCDYCCSQSGHLTKHKRTHTGKKPYKCDQCDYCCSESGTLTKHKRMHSGEKPYKCDQCDYCCSESGRLTNHKRTHTGEKPYKCDECEYCCSESGTLTKHKRTHTGEKPYRCDQCDYCCSQSGHLTKHKRTHTGKKPYKCDQCDYCCSQSGTLTKHKRMHSGEKPYKCDQCDYCCSESGRLTNHKRIHTGEKPYKCDQCDYCCSQNGHLTKHKRMHSGEKPYKCDQCDYCCSESGNLTKHKRMHSGEKPYKCEHCLKCFSQHSHRSKHHKMHEEQKKYEFACVMQDCGTQEASDKDVKCTIRCKTRLDLDYHIQRHHTEEGIAQKFKSEQQLAKFFDNNKISYDRDWLNRIAFTSCKNIEGSKSSARPDFYLHAKSAELGCVFLVGNDEFAHRQTKCEFQRIFNIANALEQTPEFKQIPIVYVRFNPHFFRKDGTFYDMPLVESHKLLHDTINNITHVPKQGVNLIYVNYDTRDGKLCIFEDEEQDNYSNLEKGMTCNDEVYTLVERDVNGSKSKEYKFEDKQDGFELAQPIVLQSCLETKDPFAAFCQIPQLPFNDRMQTMCNLSAQTSDPEAFFQKVIQGDTSGLDGLASIWESALSVKTTDPDWIPVDNTALRLPASDAAGYVGLGTFDVASMAVSNDAKDLIACYKGQLYSTGWDGLLRQVPLEEKKIISGLDSPSQSVTMNSNGIIRAALFSNAVYFYGNGKWHTDLTPELQYFEVQYQAMKLWENETTIQVAILFQGIGNEDRVFRWVVAIFTFQNSNFNTDVSFTTPTKIITNPNPEPEFRLGFITIEPANDMLLWSTIPSRDLFPNTVNVHSYNFTSNTTIVNRWALDVSFSPPKIPTDGLYYTGALVDGNLSSGQISVGFVISSTYYIATLTPTSVRSIDFPGSDILVFIRLSESVDHSRKLFVFDDELRISTTLADLIVPNQPFSLDIHTRPLVFALAPNGADAWIFTQNELYRLHNEVDWGNEWTNEFPMYFAIGARVSDFGYEGLNRNVYVPSSSPWYMGTVQRATEMAAASALPFEVARSAHETFRFQVIKVETTVPSGLPCFQYASGELQRANEYVLSQSAFEVEVANDSNVVMRSRDSTILWQSNTHDQVSIQSGLTYFSNLSNAPFALVSNNGLYLLYKATNTRLRLVFNPFNTLRMTTWCLNDQDRFNQAIIMQRNMCWNSLHVPDTLTFADSRCTCIGGLQLFEMSAPGALGIPNSLSGPIADSMPCYIETCFGGANGGGQTDTNVFRLVQQRCANRVINICKDVQFFTNIDLRNNNFVKLINCGEGQNVCRTDTDCDSGNVCFNQRCVFKCNSVTDCQQVYGMANMTCTKHRCMPKNVPKSAMPSWWVFFGILAAIVFLVTLLLIAVYAAKK